MPSEDSNKVKTLDDTVPNGNGTESVESYLGRIIEILPGDQRIFVLLTSNNEETRRTLCRKAFENARVECYVDNHFGYDRLRSVDGTLSHKVYSLNYALSNNDHSGIDLSTFVPAQQRLQPSS